ncbi:hypothetical protein TELCIR_13274, partial [Teladorsagia circumcincta]
DVSNWVVGWMDWNICLDMQGGPNWVKNFVDSPIIVNAEKQEYYKQPMWYALGHFSKFVRPNSYRIMSNFESTPPKGVKQLAFITPDEYRVVVIINTDSESHIVSINEATNAALFYNVILESHSLATVIIG